MYKLNKVNFKKVSKIRNSFFLEKSHKIKLDFLFQQKSEYDAWDIICSKYLTAKEKIYLIFNDIFLDSFIMGEVEKRCLEYLRIEGCTGNFDLEETSGLNNLEKLAGYLVPYLKSRYDRFNFIITIVEELPFIFYIYTLTKILLEYSNDN